MRNGIGSVLHVVASRWGFFVAPMVLAPVVAVTVGHAEHAVVKTTQLVDPALVSYAPSMEVAGRLSIAGSETMRPMLMKLVGDFTLLHPNVKIAVEGGGSEGAIHEFMIGYSQQRRGEKSRQGHDGAAMVTVLASSRQLTAEEKRNFMLRFGYDPIELPIAMDAVAIYVHASNPVAGLTMAELDSIFGAENKRGLNRKVETWGAVTDADAWKEQVIHRYGRDVKSGTRRFFQQHVLLDGKFKDDVLEQQGAATELLSIARDPLGIGYAGVISSASSMVRMVPVAKESDDPYVEPTADSILDGTYPLRRDLYLYINAAPDQTLNPLLREFLRFANSRQGQETVAKAKFYPVRFHQVAVNLHRLGESSWMATSRPH
jgi:phosphate transport system substrate-binding protein